MLDALDPLCKAYPQTDTQWRTESFLPYVRDCSERIQGYLKILAATEKSKYPVRYARRQCSWPEIRRFWTYGFINLWTPPVPVPTP